MAERIGSVIREWLRERGLEQEYREHSIAEEWEQIVGPRVAEKVAVVRVDNGRLYLATSSPTWRQEMVLRREDLRKKINDRFGAEVVHEIQVR